MARDVHWEFKLRVAPCFFNFLNFLMLEYNRNYMYFVQLCIMKNIAYRHEKQYCLWVGEILLVYECRLQVEKNCYVNIAYG